MALFSKYGKTALIFKFFAETGDHYIYDIRLFIKRKMENYQVLRNNNAQPKENKDSIVDQTSLPKGTENAPFCASRFVLQKVV